MKLFTPSDMVFDTIFQMTKKIKKGNLIKSGCIWKMFIFECVNMFRKYY